jgi:hypothetical protein
VPLYVAGVSGDAHADPMTALYPIIRSVLETYVDLYSERAAKQYMELLEGHDEPRYRCLRLNVCHDVVGSINEDKQAEVLRAIAMLPNLRWLGCPPSPALLDQLGADLRTYCYTVLPGASRHHDRPSLSNSVHFAARLASRKAGLEHLVIASQRHHPVSLLRLPAESLSSLRSLCLYTWTITVPDLYALCRSFPSTLSTLRILVWTLGQSVAMPAEDEPTLAQALEPIAGQLVHFEFLIDPPDLMARPRFQLDEVTSSMVKLRILRVQGLFISREGLVPLLPQLRALSLRSNSALHLADVRALLEDGTNELRALSAIGSVYEKRPPRDISHLRVRGGRSGSRWCYSPERRN